MAKKSVLSGLSDTQKRNMRNWVRRVNYDKEKRYKKQLEKLSDLSPQSQAIQMAALSNDRAYSKIKIGDFDDIAKLYKVLDRYDKQSEPNYELHNALGYLKGRKSADTDIEVDDEFNKNISLRMEKALKKLLNYLDEDELKDVMDSKFPELTQEYIYQTADTIKNEYIQDRRVSDLEKRVNDLIKNKDKKVAPKKLNKKEKSIKAKKTSLKRTIKDLYKKQPKKGKK